jgi:hypothetical protein
MQKWGGGMAQAVQNLPSKHEALSLNHSAAKKKKKKKKKKIHVSIFTVEAEIKIPSQKLLLSADL